MHVRYSTGIAICCIEKAITCPIAHQQTLGMVAMHEVMRTSLDFFLALFPGLLTIHVKIVFRFVSTF